MFFGDGSTLSTSTSFGLVDTGSTVPDVVDGVFPSPPIVGNNYSGGAFATGGTIVFGELTADSVEIGGGLSSAGTFQLVVVPEPSTSAILGLGGLVWLLRRRR